MRHGSRQASGTLQQVPAPAHMWQARGRLADGATPPLSLPVGATASPRPTPPSVAAERRALLGHAPVAACRATMVESRRVPHFRECRHRPRRLAPSGRCRMPVPPAPSAAGTMGSRSAGAASSSRARTPYAKRARRRAPESVPAHELLSRAFISNSLVAAGMARRCFPAAASRSDLGSGRSACPTSTASGSFCATWATASSSSSQCPLSEQPSTFWASTGGPQA